MTQPTGFFRGLAALGFAAAAALAPAYAEDVPAPASQPSAECRAPGELTRLDHPLSRVAHRLAAGLPVTIVAIGSSSTAGAGASSPAMSYPSRLEAELRRLSRRANVTVINRGANGEEARDMVARFERDVFAEKPDLVIWQVGSNSVLRDRPLSEANTPLREGLDALRRHGTDVVLINPQYAPKVIAKHDAERMVDLIDHTARSHRVDLFQRYAVMRYWRLTEDIPFSVFTSSDDLHMNDWSYGCIGRLLAGAIHEAATRPTMTATAGGRR